MSHIISSIPRNNIHSNSNFSKLKMFSFCMQRGDFIKIFCLNSKGLLHIKKDQKIHYKSHSAGFWLQFLKTLRIKIKTTTVIIVHDCHVMQLWIGTTVASKQYIISELL